MEYALRKQIEHLCSYISDRSAVAAYINNEYGLDLTAVDVIEVTVDDKRRYYSADHKPLSPSPLIVTHKHTGYDPLALALFKYHADRSTGAERAYWLARPLDWRPKPKTTVEL